VPRSDHGKNVLRAADIRNSHFSLWQARQPSTCWCYDGPDPAFSIAFIGGSDARIIMGEDEAALLGLWREKRGEVEAEDLSRNRWSNSTS
jgi:hypothetical protein